MNAQVHDFQAKELARKRRLQGMAMQEIEGNPLTAEDIEMFDMFDREGWSGEQCRAYIIAQARAYVPK